MEGKEANGGGYANATPYTAMKYPSSYPFPHSLNQANAINNSNTQSSSSSSSQGSSQQDEENYDDEDDDASQESQESDNQNQNHNHNFHNNNHLNYNSYGFNLSNPHPIQYHMPMYGNSSHNHQFQLTKYEEKGANCSRDDWSEEATWALLQSWSERFIQGGRKNLKLDQWNEISKRVSSLSKSTKTDLNCRNRMDTLKKKYKKEKQRVAENGVGSTWVYFRFLDGILGVGAFNSGNIGLPYGLDAGQFVCTGLVAGSLNNGRFEDGPPDSPSKGEDGGGRNENCHGHDKGTKRKNEEEDSFTFLTDSIQRFGEIYERIESSKRQQMLELEKMRIEVGRELKIRKKEIWEKTQTELARIHQESMDINPSFTNMSS